MIQGKNAITSYFESVHQPYYAIFYKGQVEKGNPIFRNDKEEESQGIDFTDGLSSFKSNLDLLGYGNYSLIISDKKNVTQRGGNRVDFKIEMEGPHSQQMGGISAIGAVTMDQVEERANIIADKRFRELMDKKELEDTRAKLKETERDLKEAREASSAPLNKFLGALSPHAETIISGIFPSKNSRISQTVISGVAPDEIADGETNKLFEDFATALCQLRPNDWKPVLIKLTAAMKNEPEKIEMALKFL